MKLLWIGLRSPLPANDGAKKASYHLLKKLTSDVDFVFFAEPGEPVDRAELQKLLSLKSITVLPKPVSRGSRALCYIKHKLCSPQTPFTLGAYDSELARQMFAKVVCESGPWDFTVLDGLHAVAVLNALPKKLRSRLGKLIYRAHNVESELWRQSREMARNLPMRLVLSYEESLYLKLEKQTCRSASLTLPVSDIDTARFKKLYGDIRAETLPIGLDLSAVPPVPSGPLDPVQLLFVGRLDWSPNRDGLQWFLEAVFPKLEPRTILHIVGSGESTWIVPYLVNPRIRFSRNPPDLKQAYKDAHLTLIPLFLGSGTRVKAIESGSLSRSFISTAIGVEGLPFTPGQDYLAAETADEWIATINALKIEKIQEMSRQIQRVTASSFDETHVARSFEAKLNSLNLLEL